MKTLAILAAGLIAAFPAAAERFRAHLIGYQEVPSVNSTGVADFTADLSDDGTALNYTMTFKDLQAPIAQSHIHFAQPSVNGPIIIWLCGTTALPGPAGTQTCPQSGTITGTITSANILGTPATQQLPAGDFKDVVNAMRAGAAYANIHTAVSPAGEIRGQIFRSFH